MSVRFVASVLYELGFNVIPVDENKKPIGSWSADKRLQWDELERRLSKATGVAVTGRYLEDENYGVVVLDLDDVDSASEVLAKVFGGDWQARLCGQGWSFCGLTGPRPKGKVKCGCKSLNEDCDCVIQDTGERRKLSELRRGMYIVVRVPKNCLPGGTTRSDAIEVMATNYEVVYGKHPSGVFYQPVRHTNGEWVPLDIEDVGQGEVITCDELKTLITLIKQSTVSKLEEVGGETRAIAEFSLPEPTKDLSEESINQLINLVKPVWWLESDEGKHYHDIILYGLSSLMRRAGIKYETAREIVRTIIQLGIQDIAGKVDPNTLQQILRNEERHFRETVDYVYTKPTSKPWGRETFEQAMSPVIEKAINQGLLSGFSSPSEWFNAVYETIYGKRKHGENAVTNENVVAIRELDPYLPSEDGVATVPTWAVGLELRNYEHCLHTLQCKKSLVIYTREDSQYAIVAIKTMVKAKGGDEDGENEEKPDYAPIALLPKYMGQVYDPFYEEWFFVALHNGKVIAVSTEFDDFIKALTNKAGLRYYATENRNLLGLINSLMPTVRLVVSPGITDDGFVDPYGVLDVNDYGVEPLLKAYEWVRKYYPETNARWAWFNVMAVLAKIITPMVRYINKTFNDMIIYNVGHGGEGKSSLVRYVLLRLLGGEDARSTYYVIIDGPIKTDAQLRNLLNLNRLPLILDEQNKKALANNVGIFLSAVVGLGTVGVQASKYGHGIAVRFKNLRGMVVFTNVPFVSFLRDIVHETSDYAIIRRFIEIAWDTEPISPNAFKDLPELNPIYGFATKLWQKYKDELVKSSDLLELIGKLAVAIGREHMGDAKVDEMVQYTLDIVNELREMKKNERLALTDADALIERAYQFVADELKTSPSSAVKVLRYLLENPQKAGIKLATPRSREEREKLKNELDVAIHKYLVYKYGIEDTQDRGIIGKDPDAVTLYVLLKNAYDEEKVTAVFFKKSPLVPGTPRVFLGARESSYIINGVVKNGYAIPLARLVKIFLGRELEDENEESGETTEEPSSNGESP